MSSPSPMTTPEPWDLVSSIYTAEVAPILAEYAADALRLADPPAGTRIVDVACGPGTLAILAAERGHTVDALDFAPQMIDRCDMLVRERGITTIHARVGDGQALPYADGAYGAGFSMFGLMFFPDRIRGFAELRRVLAPGARAVVSSWPPLEDNPVMAATFGALRTAVGRVLSQPPPPPPGVLPMSTAVMCREEMSEAFADVEVHRIVHTQRYPSAEGMWESVSRTMAPLVLMRRNLGEDRWATVDAEARAAMVEAIGDREPVLEMPAWLSVGVAR